MAVVIPEELFSTIKCKGKTEQYSPKEKIFTQGEDASHFFVVSSGRVRVYTISANGKERTIEVLEKGRVFGDSSFLTNSKRTVTIEAVVPSEIIRYDTEELTDMCAESPQLMKLIFQHMADTCNYLTHQIIQSSHYNSTQKLVDFFLGESLTRNVDILPYTHEEIADSVSLNRVTVSRIISVLKQNKLLDVQYGKVKILNRDGLKKLLPNN